MTAVTPKISKAAMKDSRHGHDLYKIEPASKGEASSSLTRIVEKKPAKKAAHRSHGVRDSIRVGTLQGLHKKVDSNRQLNDKEGADLAARKVQNLLNEFDDIILSDEETTDVTASTTASAESQTQPQEAQANNNNSTKKRVQFSAAHYHEHANIMGDNPACSSGYPLTIDWKALNTRTLALNPDEPERQHRSYADMRLSVADRDAILKRAGYSRGQLVQLNRQVNIDRARRSRTQETYALHGLQDAMKRASQKLSRTFASSEEQQKRAKMKQWRKGGPQDGAVDPHRRSSASCIVPQKIRTMNSMDTTSSTV